MKKIFCVILFAAVVSSNLNAQHKEAKTKSATQAVLLPPAPAVPPKQPLNSVPMGDLTSFPEMKLDIPVATGPFEPTWESIEKNYPGEPAWLREAKFGIWVHFGP